MESLNEYLAHIWFMIAGLMLLLYVVTDGFDLGVGILTLFAPSEEQRSVMVNSLSSIWDANETWLILLGGTLFGAFPLVYATVLHALYIPFTLMLFGLIFRGVAFEFRENARRKKFWNYSFGIGSFVAAASQGLVLGGILSGINVADDRFVGGVFDWFTPFSLVVAVGVVFGYTLLGAAYLIIKTEGKIQQDNFRHARYAAWAMFIAAGIITVYSPFLPTQIAAKWFTPPGNIFIALLPALAIFSFLMLLRALKKSYEFAPFLWSLLIFIASFIGLAVSISPYIIPGEITIYEAASSPRTLIFMLVGVGMLIPIMLAYNGYLYLVFRGKVQPGGYHHD